MMIMTYMDGAMMHPLAPLAHEQPKDEINHQPI